MLIKYPEIGDRNTKYRFGFGIFLVYQIFGYRLTSLFSTLYCSLARPVESAASSSPYRRRCRRHCRRRRRGLAGGQAAGGAVPSSNGPATRPLPGLSMGQMTPLPPLATGSRRHDIYNNRCCDAAMCVEYVVSSGLCSAFCETGKLFS